MSDLNEKALVAARDALMEMCGIYIHLPSEGDLDDLERAQFEGLEAAIAAYNDVMGLSALTNTSGDDEAGQKPIGYVTKNELTKLRLGVSCVDLFGSVVPAGFEMVPVYAHPQLKSDEAPVAWRWRWDDGNSWIVEADKPDDLPNRVVEPLPARPQSAAVRDGWQPIETAPKDGTRVDLWAYRGECGAHGYREGERYTDCRFTRSTYGTEPFGDPRWQGLNDRYIKVTPTHWMPLPSPPALHSTQEG